MAHKIREIVPTMMFERYNQAQTTRRSIAVQIILNGGETLNGQLLSYNASSLIELMNGERAFLEFETYDGEPVVIAKSSVQQILPVEAPDAVELDHSMLQIDRFDPFAILGVTREADSETVREAYRDMVKLYHPDRYAGLELPREVLNYMASVSKRINAAFTAVSEHVQEREKRAAQRKPQVKPEPKKPVFKMTPKRRGQARAMPARDLRGRA